MNKKTIYGLLVFGVVLYCGHNITMEEKKQKSSSEYAIPNHLKKIADKPLFTTEDKELQDFVKKYPKISIQVIKFLEKQKAKAFFPWYIKGRHMEYETKVTVENLKQIALWSAMAKAFGFLVTVANGYIFFKNPKRPKGSNRNTIYLPSLTQGLENNPKKAQLLKELVQQYKIHLMPKDITDAFYQLLQLFTKKKYRNSIYEFKLHFYPEDTALYTNTVFPRFVIYPFSSTNKGKAIGKKVTQSLVNMLYKDISNLRGTGLTPRFNQKITDLIFVAQGDGGHKTQEHQKYFEENKIYYAAWLNKKGNNPDYKIKHPKDNKHRWRKK